MNAELLALLDQIASLSADQTVELEQRLAEFATAIPDLSAEDLTAAQERLLAAFDALDGADGDLTADRLQAMSVLADAQDGVRGQQENLATAETEAADAAAEREARAAELRERRAANTPADEVDVPDEGADETEVEQPDTEPVPVAATARQTVATRTTPRTPARRAPLGQMRTPADAAPAARRGDGGAARFRLVAAGASGTAEVGAGEAIPDISTLGRLMHDRLRKFGTAAFAETQYVARWQLDRDSWPEDRKLGGNAWENHEKIEAATSPQALTASGGICNPVNTVYDVPTWGADDRPLKNSLPSFNADRGGLRFVSPPKLTQSNITTGATAVWTEANDVSPSAPAVKPVGIIACATENEVYVDAIPTRLQIGNMMGRFSPEQVAANTVVAMHYAARVAELNLLAKITAASTSLYSQQLLGAHRDILATLDLTLAAARYRHRMPRSQRFHVTLPEFAKDLMRADLVRQTPHDTIDTRALPDSVIDAWFTVRGCNVTWIMDGAPTESAWWTGGTGSDVATVVPAAQTFGAQANKAYGVDWPLNLQWWIWPEGSFLFLDGGQMNLGVVRDSVLDGTNDYETFVEPFEGLAFRGVESLRIDSTVLATGAYAAPITTQATPSVLPGAAAGAHGGGGSF